MKNSAVKCGRGNKTCRSGFNKLTLVFYIFVGCMVAGVGVYYLGILNSKAQIGFETAALEDKLNSSKEINKNLEVAASELQQVTRVQEAAGKLGMILTGKVDYLSVKKSDLATR